MAIFARFRSSHVHRFRSADRDRATDQLRLERIREAVQVAIAAIDTEENGVKWRLDEASSRAALIAGNDAEDYLQRDAAEENLLTAAEREMMRATRRLEELHDRRLFFSRMLENLNKALQADAAGTETLRDKESL